MARGRKSGPGRMDLRRQAEAAEARDAEAVKDDDEEKDDDDEEEDDEEDAEEAEEAVADDDEASEDEDEAPKKKPKKKPAAVKKPAVKRARPVKEVRTKAVWVVFDNGSKQVESFPYNQKAEAEEFLARKIEEKKATFYLQLVKEALD